MIVMATFECKYCGKVYKTQKGLEKHHCKEMDRYNDLTDVTDYVYTIFHINYVNSKMPSDKEERKMLIIKSKYYDIVKSLEKWAVETNPINFMEYVKYLKNNLVPFKKWTLDHTYHCFLYQYLKEESTAIAIQRAETFLKNNGLTIDTISSNRLFLAIKYGMLSPKYLKYVGVNAAEKLDEKQWIEVRPFFVESFEIF